MVNIDAIKKYCKWIEEACEKNSEKNSEKAGALFLADFQIKVADAVKKNSLGIYEDNFDGNLETAFKDLLISLITIAIRYGIDLDSAFYETKKSIERRYILK